MPQYRYRALDKTGKEFSGVLEAASEWEAHQRIARMHAMPLSLRKIHPAWDQLRSALTRLVHRPVSTRDLILFTRQFHTLIRAGVPHAETMGVLEQQSENPRLRRVIRVIAADLAAGMHSHMAFARHPDIFRPLYTSVLHAGERGDALPQVLERLMGILEHEARIRNELKAAFHYPLIVLAVLSVAFLVQMLFVMPRFIAVFQAKKITLPLPTRVCIGLHHLLTDYWPVILPLLVTMTLGLLFAVSTPSGSLFRDRVLLRLPMVGGVARKAAMSRFASILSILQFSGVSIVEAMKVLASTIGNLEIAHALGQAQKSIEQGTGISASLKASGQFPPLVINMVAVGERSGQMADMLRDVASHYDAEVEYAMKNLSESAGPLLTLIMAAIVGFFALAIFLPMWEISRMGL